MKKLILIVFAAWSLLIISGCQTSNEALSANEFVEQFATDFLSFKYEANTSQQESYNKQSEKLQSYFTEESYLYFTNNNYGIIPILAAEKYQSDINVKSIQLEELFNEETKVGYTVDVKLELPSDVATLSLTLSVSKEGSSWKIYAIRISNVDESLQ